MKLLALLMLTLGLVLPARAATDYPVTERWPENVFTFVYLPTDAPDVDEAAVETSFEAWNEIARIEVKYGGRVGGWWEQGDGQNMIGWGFFGSAARSATTVRHAHECDIILNADTPGMDFSLLVIHEIGHCLGLQHNDMPSVMNLDTWGQFATPTVEDRNALIGLYGLPFRSVVAEVLR